jgi:hypothetical protein
MIMPNTEPTMRNGRTSRLIACAKPETSPSKIPIACPIVSKNRLTYEWMRKTGTSHPSENDAPAVSIAY